MHNAKRLTYGFQAVQVVTMFVGFCLQWEDIPSKKFSCCLFKTQIFGL